jgi:rare lipoprotein A
MRCLNGQVFAAIALHCPVALLPGRGGEVFTMYRSALLAAALLSIAQAAKAESGLASYYGGHSDRGEMTCAHRTRPLGSIVTVTRAGHSVQCRVNDRGPFVGGRVIDVSIRAAHGLGMMRAGVVRVSVQ